MTESQYDDYFSNFSSSSLDYMRSHGDIIVKSAHSCSYNINIPDLKAIILTTQVTKKYFTITHLMKNTIIKGPDVIESTMIKVTVK